jgi:hypothetical protein
MSYIIGLDEQLIRISPTDSNKLEYSTNGGRSWNQRYNSSSPGGFEDLIDNGDEILALTAKGLYYSIDMGRSWRPRKRCFTMSKHDKVRRRIYSHFSNEFKYSANEFEDLTDNGDEILATTRKDL